MIEEENMCMHASDMHKFQTDGNAITKLFSYGLHFPPGWPVLVLDDEQKNYNPMPMSKMSRRPTDGNKFSLLHT